VTLHRSAFIKALREQFPAVEVWLAGNRNGLTFEMMRFPHFTQDAIAKGDLTLVRQCFQFLNTAFENGNRHLRNSIVVSFLEHLEFAGSNGAAAEKLLPGALATERAEMIAHFTRLGGRPRKHRRA
jgi:hypothetical protein